jgi:uncharacterized protein (UPF0261 family)
MDVKDIVMFPSIVDIATESHFARPLSRAAGAICGMVEVQIAASADKPLIVASQFGNTTPCVDHAPESWRRQAMKWLFLQPSAPVGERWNR